MPTSSSPIGVFDSGVGGLSVLQALRAVLPHERFVYFADTGYAPYGERSEAFVRERSHAITDFLRTEHHIKALVVACNTATAAAIDEVRAHYPDMPAVGVEPALKPAVVATQTGRVGVMGTRGTLASAKFGRLLASLAGQAQFVLQACDGLAYAIECASQADIERLCQRYTTALGTFGTQPGAIDTLVLGCTHYVFAQDVLRDLVGPQVQLIATGEPVARQTQRLLHSADSLAANHGAALPLEQALTLWTSGPLPLLQTAAQRWLGLEGGCFQYR